MANSYFGVPGSVVAPGGASASAAPSKYLPPLKTAPNISPYKFVNREAKATSLGIDSIYKNLSTTDKGLGRSLTQENQRQLAAIQRIGDKVIARDQKTMAFSKSKVRGFGQYTAAGAKPSFIEANSATKQAQTSVKMGQSAAQKYSTATQGAMAVQQQGISQEKAAAMYTLGLDKAEQIQTIAQTQASALADAQAKEQAAVQMAQFVQDNPSLAPYLGVGSSTLSPSEQLTASESDPSGPWAQFASTLASIAPGVSTPPAGKTEAQAYTYAVQKLSSMYPYLLAADPNHFYDMIKSALGEVSTSSSSAPGAPSTTTTRP